ncbi:hypothetical protein [Sphingobium phenoxybenzoativorans]|uniref:hypothetical protein n=1 Tax=Sphingobium phenoxybenzoativorans TaxID=1592790 RepID=UPI0014954A00|nr:hypothetical protein [Sphingobium phenoxybenzoativorans]
MTKLSASLETVRNSIEDSRFPKQSSDAPLKQAIEATQRRIEGAFNRADKYAARLKS